MPRFHLVANAHSNPLWLWEWRACRPRTEAGRQNVPVLLWNSQPGPFETAVEFEARETWSVTAVNYIEEPVSK